MDLLAPIKLFFGQFFLKRELKHFYRTQKFYNFKLAESFGIVYEYKNEEEFKVLEHLIHQLNDDKKKVKVIVYIKDQKLLEYIPQRLTVDYINPKDLDWFGRPKSPYAKDFMNASFQVLLDLNFKQSFPLSYITSLSKANYKVGLFDIKSKDRLDMMLKVKSDQGLKYVLREMFRYLKLIKSR